MRVPLEQVPPDVCRRVAEHLESIRGTPMAPGGDAAQLGVQACPIFRPDLKDVAYWEIEVAGVTATTPRAPTLGRPIIKQAPTGLGFVIAAAGRHDVPIPHWSLAKSPPSHALEAIAGVGKVARVVKLDALSYVAEDAAGNHLAHLGQIPPRIVGLPTDQTALSALSTVISGPAAPVKDDSAYGDRTSQSTGAPVPKLKLVGWESWAQAKEGYAAAYQPHLAALAAHAADSWAVVDLIAKFGEGIHEGDQLTVPLLKPGKAQVSGDGAASVQLTQLERQPPAVVLKALPSAVRQEIHFELQLTYADGTTEALPFFVVPAGTPSSRPIVLTHPLVQVGGLQK